MVPSIADNFDGLRHGTPDEPEPRSSKRPINLKLSDDGHYQQTTDDSGLSAKLGGFRGRAIGIDSQDRVHHSALRGLSRISQLEGTKGYIEVENRANTSIDVIEKLSRHQNIFGLKDASLDTGRLLSIYNRCGDNLQIYAASSHIGVNVMLLGGKGLVSGPACEIPRQSVRLYNLCVQRRWDDAIEIQ